MQKKLYFLDQEEKNRILNLHESRTRKQYLVNEVYGKEFDDFTKKIKDICKTKPYGQGNLSADKSIQNAKLLRRNEPTLGMWGENALKTFGKNISSFNLIQNFCQVNDSYTSLGYGNLINLMRTTISNESAWNEYFKKPFESLIENSENSKKTEKSNLGNSTGSSEKTLSNVNQSIGGNMTEEASKDWELLLQRASQPRVAGGGSIIQRFSERYINDDIRNLCNDLKSWGTPNLDNNTLKRINSNISAALEGGMYQVTTLTGRGVTKDTVKSFVSNIKKFLNIPNFCQALNLSKTQSLYDTDILAMFDRISGTSSGKGGYPEIIGALQSLKDDTPIVSKTETTKKIEAANVEQKKKIDTSKSIFYKNFPCLENLTNTELNTSNDGTQKLVYVDGDIKYHYFIDGRAYYEKGSEIYPEGETNFYSFTCGKRGLPVLDTNKIIKSPFENMTCILNSGAKSHTDSKGITKLRKQTGSISEFFYPDGRYYTYNSKTEEMSPSGKNYYTWSCKGDSDYVVDETEKDESQFQAPAKTETKTPEVSKGKVVSKRPIAPGIGQVVRVQSQIPSLLQSAGIAGTELTQDAINQLYNKLV